MSSKQDILKKRATAVVDTLFSLLRIALFSRLKPSLPQRETESDEIIILGNGPSFKSLIEEKREFWQGRSRLMVNFSACSEWFEVVKPQNYLVADPLFWESTDKCERLFGALSSKCEWEMNLFMPVKAFKNRRWQEIIASNHNIKLHPHNTTPVEGLECFTKLAYNKGWGVPRPHNVLIPSIAITIRMRYKKIYLAGAEHSWVNDVGISDDNRVVMNFKHFYDNGKPDAKEMAQYAEVPFYQFLYHQFIVFRAYFQLRDYAKSEECKVINITPGSFIDAFERLKI
ncbi:MAG: hypothetical protein ACRCTF_00995 [Bacteroidales bacterium]